MAEVAGVDLYCEVSSAAAPSEHDAAQAAICEANDELVRWQGDSDVSVSAVLKQRDSALRRIARLRRDVARLQDIVDEQDADNRWLRERLQAQNGEIDEVRAVATDLQRELDEALRSADDMRIELSGSLETAQDEANALRAEADEAFKMIEELRDHLRDEQRRYEEEIRALSRRLEDCWQNEPAPSRRGDSVVAHGEV